MMWRLERFGRDWNELATRNAFGAIWPDAEGRPRTWNVDEFFETGKADAARFIADLERIAPSVPRGRLLDFGCGVGRVSRAFANYFQSVIGMDVAPAMISHARRLNASCARCEFVVSGRAHLRRFPADAFDVVYSRLVLQHVPPALVRIYIPELIRVLTPGGVLMFQLPEHVGTEPEESFVNAPVTGSRWKQQLPRVVVRAWRHLKYWLIVDEPHGMAMFGMPRDEVLSLIRDTGGRVLAITPDQSHGPTPAGYEYWVARRG